MKSTQELVGIHNNSAHKSWSEYTTDDKSEKLIKQMKNLPVCSFLKNTTIPCEYYLQYYKCYGIKTCK